MKVSRTKYIFSVLYVDDILFVANDTDLLVETKQLLFSHFDMKDLGCGDPQTRLDPTRLADPNRNPEDARSKPLTKSVYQIHFILKYLRKRFQFRASP